MGCRFCATGLQGYTRNLSAREIAGQAVAMDAFLGWVGRSVRGDSVGFGSFPKVLRVACGGRTVSSLWLAAQGEPLLNADAAGDALGMLRRRFDEGISRGVATCAPLEGLGTAARWCRSGVLDAVSVTLHSAVQPVRDRMMPGASPWVIPQVKEALRAFRFPQLEIAVALEEGENADAESLRALAGFCSDLGCSVGLSVMLSPQGYPLAFPRTLRFAEEMLRASDVLVRTYPYRPRHIIAEGGRAATDPL